MIQINAAARLPPNDEAWHLIRNELSTSKLSGLPPSSSVWPRSPFSCSPFGEHTGRGDSAEALCQAAGNRSAARISSDEKKRLN